MNKEHQVIFSGEGGQGLVLAGMLLGEAAAIFDNKHATQTVEYGIASRGGFAMAEIKISAEEIACPELPEPDYIVALTEEAFNRFRKEAEKSTIIYDSDAFQPSLAGDKIKGYPFTGTIRELTKKYGDKVRINILALGAVLGFEQIVSLESLREALRERFGEKGAELNMIVLQAGMEMTR